jgi:hypothetical protein
LPADRYRVEIYPSSASGDRIVFDKVIVWANEPTLLRKRSPHERNVVPEPVTFEEEYQQNPLLQRWVWGTAGAVVLAGGAVWSFALADWRVRDLREVDFKPTIAGQQTIADEQKFEDVRTAKAIELGLLVTGALFLHAEIAAYLFSRMPPSRRPGAPLLGIGAGLLASGIVTAGHAVQGYLSWNAANKNWEQAAAAAAAAAQDSEEREQREADKWKYEQQQHASANVGWVGSAATGALVVSGTILVALGAERGRTARHNGIVLPARVPRYQQPGFVPIVLGSGLLIAGSGFVGLGIPALAIEEGRPSAIVGLVGGGILATSGVVLVSVGAKRKRSSKSRTAIVPSFSPNALGLQVVGQF